VLAFDAVALPGARGGEKRLPSEMKIGPAAEKHGSALPVPFR
jgi:hypothetical protein